MNNQKNAKAQEIIDFWLNDVGSENWYKQSDEIDAQIRSRYKALRDEAAQGAHDQWLDSPEGALALMLLLDQFSRNLYRGDGESFAADAHARELAKRAIERGYPDEFDYELRQFFYMPFCHSEELADHNWLLREALGAGLAKSLVDFHAHHDIIEKFGRFPFRNEALGRASSQAEQDFMENGGYMTLRQKWVEKLGD